MRRWEGNVSAHNNKTGTAQRAMRNAAVRTAAVFAWLIAHCALRPSMTQAATISAASCASADVQSAINVASSGDTVAVPGGNCTWNSTVSISNKKLTLQGAGIDLTNITDNGSGGAALSIDASAANFVALTGFTFIKGADHPQGMIQVGGAAAEVAFRIHHLRLWVASSGSRGIYVDTVFGLIDHVTFDVTAPSGSIQMTSLAGSSEGTDGGFTPWTRPLTLGTANAVYIEDNSYNYGSTDEDCIDAYSGARFVIRHNTFLNAHIGFHGTDTGGSRGPVSHEVYDNTFTNNTASTFESGRVRGGTGVWFNNTYGGSHGSWYGLSLMVYRACFVGPYGWGACDGTNWQLGSTNLVSQASRTASINGGVKFCSNAPETLCTADANCGGSGTCSRFLDGSGTGGYACRDQPGRGPGQVLAPIYAWNNSGGGVLGAENSGSSCGIGLSNYLQSGRDYVNGTPMPGYSPYVYPHPLQGGGGSTSSPCDVNGDSSTNVVDVQQAVNQALGSASCVADINRDGACNVVDVQRVVNAALGGACVSP
jgi:hypothetical protein